MYSCGPLHMAIQKQDDQLEHTSSSYVMIRDVTLKTCQRRWMIGRRGERGSGISVLTARHDDKDETKQNLPSYLSLSVPICLSINRLIDQSILVCLSLSFYHLCQYVSIYLYRLIGQVVRVFANDPGDQGTIPGRVIPKNFKMVLDTSLLNTQRYKERIKG